MKIYSALPKAAVCRPKRPGAAAFLGERKVQTKKHLLPDYIQTVIEKLENAGFEVFVVGGAVRDLLLEKAPPDYDLTTNALPDEIVSVFADKKLLLTGLKHGTVTVIEQHHPVEITTYRVDGSYSDSRHPDSICFARDITQDLARRDFTVNAMCFQNGAEIYDPFGGREDLKNRVLRTVGEPEQRFLEDALRMMRGLRFSATLGFKLEPQTEAAIFQHAILLRNISRERILAELKKLFLGDWAAEVFNRFLFVLLCAEPTFSEVLANGSDPVNFNPVGHCPAELPLRVAAFYICFIRAERSLEAFTKGDFVAFLKSSKNVEEWPFAAVEKSMQALRFDKKTTQQVGRLLQLFLAPTPKTELEICRFCAKTSLEETRQLYLLQTAFYGQNKMLEEFHRQCEVCFERCDSAAALKLSGNDLKQLGFEGKKVGKMLSRLLCAVRCGHCENNRSDLLQYVKNQQD